MTTQDGPRAPADREPGGERRERIVVALSGGPADAALVARAARLARTGPAELLAVHVASRARPPGAARAGGPPRLRRLAEDAGGVYHQVAGEDVAGALLEFAAAVGATQLVLGADRRPPALLGPALFGPALFGPVLGGRRGPVLRGGVADRVARAAGDVDVHLVARADGGRRGPLPARGGPPGPRSPRSPLSPLSRRRRECGWALAVAGPAALAALLRLAGHGPGLTADVLLFLAVTVAVALVGGLWPALVAAVTGFLLANWFFTPPLHTLTVAEPGNAAGLAVSVAVAVVVSSLVDRAARRTRQAARSAAEAETLSLLATSVLRGEQAIPALLDRVAETFAVSSVELLERTDGGWRAVARTGDPAPAEPGSADAVAPAGEAHVLALRGRPLPAGGQRVLRAFASQAGAALEWRRLAEEAERARREAEGNRIRTALLAAVSHDLRTPLASIKAGVSSLRAADVSFDPADEADLLAGIEESADRLDGLIGDLLDMTRLRTGGVTPLLRPVALEEVLPSALLGAPADRVEVDVPGTLGPVLADPGLLERALANVVENGVRHGGPRPVRVTARAAPGRVELRVADRGPGVPDDAKEGMFAPFQRLGDAPAGTGVGLGLAVARGFVAAMGGTLRAEDTPGGGLTMVFALPPADDPPGGTP
ncbi:DUF4118 domain-containing protein [Actinomadura atramentaria]|uniref:DUF4118 domain-containing protein n=1 Tax=Actinomadura atramentaria TaxID=1990 RepID=UPI00036AA42F|nr:DUF4118 domain-containing protein [Actinomadura atramentaria]